MSGSTEDDRLPLVGHLARNLAAGVVFVASLISLFSAFLVSWSPGMTGEHKGDEGVRDALVAIAMLAIGSMFSVLFVGFFLLDILVRVKTLTCRSAQATGDLQWGVAALHEPPYRCAPAEGR